MTNRDQQRDEQRKRILEIALEEFNRHGFNGTSTRRITEIAGVSSGLLFHYFPSKVSLYEELVRIAFRYIDIDLEALTIDPLTFFHNQAEFVLSLLRENPRSAAMFTFMAYAEQHPGVSDIVDHLFIEHDLVKRSVPIIEAGQRDGSLRQGNPEALGVAFWSALQGLAAEVAARGDRALPESAWIVDILTERNPK